MKVPAPPGGQAGTQEETISKAKQSRSEKKARKALSKLGLCHFFVNYAICANILNLVGPTQPHLVFCCEMLCISAAYAVMRCLSICHFRVLKRVIISANFFSPSDGHTILVFPYQTLWQIGNTPMSGSP